MKDIKIAELEVNKHCIFRAAMMKWGVIAQLDMLIEESSEFIHALCHFKREPGIVSSTEKLIEEAADFKLCMDQLFEIIFPYLAESNCVPDLDFEKLFEEAYYRKLERLQIRLGM